MALQIVTKKRHISNTQKISFYLNKNWNKKVAEEFVQLVKEKIILLSEQPNLGKATAIKNVKSVLVGKGFQNRLYYRIEKDKLIILNIIDTRRNPKNNPFNKAK